MRAKGLRTGRHGPFWRAFGVSGWGVFPWTEELEQWRLLSGLMRDADPDGGWPDVSDEALLRGLDEWSALCAGNIPAFQFSRIDLASALRALLWETGSVRLRTPRPRIWKFLRDHPCGCGTSARRKASFPCLPSNCRNSSACRSLRPAGGRIPVLVHLLSPAGRPLQITRSSCGSGKTGIRQSGPKWVGRYPKHPWPEDPSAAIPTRLTNRRLQKRP